MRNLKRALSLTLASVMLLGMMVVGSSAAGYPDVSEEENIEAIEVLQAVGVMGGDENGNFNPDDYVTREQMAVIMAQLLKLDYNYYKGTNPFSDVPEWAAPYVAACAANGVTAGIGGGLYGSKQNIQAVQAALMMLKALGYFQYAGDYEGGYILATVKQGSEIGLFEGIDSNADSALTRNEIAQMALNALKADMVSFTGDPGITYTGSNGESWVGGYKAEYTPRTSTQTKYQAIERRTSDVASDLNHKGQYYIQLGEELYDGKLRLNDNTTDPFGRPSRKWEYDGKEVGTYAKYEMLKQEYTTKVTGKDLYELIGKGTIDDKDYDFYISVDGETEKEVLNSQTSNEKDHYFFDRGSLLRTNTNQVGGTGNGVLTQVFVDTIEKDVYIAVINTYLAEAEADYDEKKDEVSFTLYNLDEYQKALVKDKNNDKPQLKVSGDEFDVKDVADGDKFLATVAEGEIQSLTPVKTIEDATITAFRLDTYLVTEGTQYDYASTARYDTETLDAYNSNNMKDTKYRVFLDNYGYVIGVEIVEDTDQYVFLTAIDSVTQNRQDATGEGTLIFLDGTVDGSAKIDLKKSKNAAGKTFVAGDNASDGTGISSLMNTWCTYSVSEDGVYTLTEVANDSTSFTASSKAGQSHLVDTNQSADGNYKYGNASITQDGANSDEGVIKTIGKKSIYLPGIASTDFKTVYGNDESIYMSAELDLITADKTLNSAADVGGVKQNENAPAVIITGVDSITTGVQNASINVWNARRTVYSDSDWAAETPYLADVSNGVYTLFDNKGYVIAAITVGEDDSTSTQYAWISSEKMFQEGYASNKWTYIREVIIDGKVDWLTEVETDGATAASIRSDLPTTSNSWVWEVKMKADGTVKEAKRISDWNTGDGANKKFIDDMKYVDENTQSTIVLNQNFTGSNWKIRDVGRTLHVETNVSGYSEGFPVASDANIIVVKDEEIYKNEQPTGNYNWKNEKSDSFVCGSDGKGLQNAVKALNDSDQFKGYIFAVFKDNVAQSIVIYDQTKTEVDINNAGGGNSGNEKIINVDTTDPAAVVINHEGPAADLTVMECLAAIQKELESQGLKVVKVSPVAGGYSFETEGGMNLAYTWNSSSGKQEQVKINVVGKGEVYYDTTSTTGSAIATALKISDAGSYVKVSDTPQAIGDSITPAAGMKLDFGYYKIDVDGSVTKTGSNGGGTVTAALKGGDTAMYVKSADTDVVITVSYSAAVTGTGIDIKNATYAVKNGTIAADASAGSKDITVTVPKSAVENSPTITLTGADHVADVTFKIDGHSVTYKADNLPTNWSEVFQKAGIAGSVDFTSYVAEKPTAGSVVTTAHTAGGAVGFTLATDKEYETGYRQLKVATPFADTNMGETSATWTLDGDTIADATSNFYAKDDSELVCTLTTTSTGFTAGSSQYVEIAGFKAAIKEAYDATATAPGGVNTAKLTYTDNETYKNGVVTFTLTVSGNKTDIAVTVSAS